MLSPLRNQDIALWPLVGSGGDNPSWSAGGQLNFNLRDVPAVTDGKLCNHLMGIMVEVSGTLDNTNTTAATLYRNDLSRVLFSDAQLEGAWHGVPISSNHVKGGTLNPIEWFGSGFQFWNGLRQDFAGQASAGVTFKHCVFLPLSAGSLVKSHHTALPVALYRNSQLKLTCSAASVLTGLCTGAALTSTTVRAFAVMVPSDEILLGPAVEWIRYTYGVTSSAQEIVQLDSFGNSSALVGTEPGAGLLNLLWLGSANGMGGCDLVENISRLSVPWRDLPPMTTVMPLVHRMNVLAGLDFGLAPNASPGENSFYVPYPYRQGINTAAQVAYPTLLPIVMAAPEQELSKLQTVEGTKSINIVQTQSSGEHVFLAQHVRSWSPNAMADAISQLVNAGVVDAVLRTRDVAWAPKLAKKQGAGTIGDRKLRYLPLKLYPASEVAAA